MSWVALASERYDEAVRFYRTGLGFPLLRSWDRPGARGAVFDLGGGLKLELLDAAAQKRPLCLEPAGDRCHLVVEVADLDAARSRLAVPAPEPETTSWGARVFQLRDPDGVAVWFLQWLRQDEARGA